MSARVDARDLLADAAQCLKSASEQLDGSGHTCPTCGVFRRSNFPESTIKRDIDSMALRVRKLAQAIRNLEETDAG